MGPNVPLFKVILSRVQLSLNVCFVQTVLVDKIFEQEMSKCVVPKILTVFCMCNTTQSISVKRKECAQHHSFFHCALQHSACRCAQLTFGYSILSNFMHGSIVSPGSKCCCVHLALLLSCISDFAAHWVEEKCQNSKTHVFSWLCQLWVKQPNSAMKCITWVSVFCTFLH